MAINISSHGRRNNIAQYRPAENRGADNAEILYQRRGVNLLKYHAQKTSGAAAAAASLLAASKLPMHILSESRLASMAI